MISLSVLVRMLLFFGILFLVDFYVFSAVKTIFSSVRVRTIASWIYWILSISFFLIASYVFLTSKGEGPSEPGIRVVMGLFVLLYIPKLAVILFLGLEDIYRLLRAGAVALYKVSGSDAAVDVPYFESRRKFISQLAVLAASIPGIGILYGITKGKYNFKVHRVDLAFKDLPAAFHGMTITQISDLHVGSYGDKEEVQRAVELINEQKSDVVFFTGDLVNNRADEMEPWVDTFSQIHAPMGKYSILGNHDYGDYVQWPSEQAKHENMFQLFHMHERLGFKLLRNQNHRFEKDGQHIELLGMENWGKGFAQYGDLKKTMQTTREESFKILLSHDPSHWEEQVMNHEKNIHLTLAGHTHGMQFGLEIPGFRFSPVQLKYKRWAGLYTENERHLYINRGLGFIGFPGRVGIWPEITVITLQKA
jgi:predicted MPP superfamily phosphohydrolase